MLKLKDLNGAEVFGTRITAQSFDIRMIAPNVVILTTRLDDSGQPLPASLREIPMLLPQQTHTVNVAVADKSASAGLSAGEQPAIPFPETDALITASAGLALGVRTADCLPVLLADPEAGVIAAVHAGWRGTVGGILRRTVDEMIKQDADPQRIIVYFGAAICEDCFEVGEEVADEFRAAGFGEAISTGKLDPLTWNPHLNSGITVSLVKANLLQISDIIPDKNIIFSNQCTRHEAGRYPSWRRDGATASRLVSAIVRL